MCFALAFVSMFVIGGLSGIYMAATPIDLHIHDTYFIVAHIHYVLFGGSLFGAFAGIYYWFPKITGRQMSELLGKLHFWPSLVFMNGIFFPMFIQGLAGMSRRMYDGGLTYAHNEPVLILNKVMSHSAFALGAVQVFFIINLLWSLARGPRVESNPWQATTLEWTAPSPPLARGNFAAPPTVYRAPYEYNVPGDEADFTPQSEARGIYG